MRLVEVESDSRLARDVFVVYLALMSRSESIMSPLNLMELPSWRVKSFCTSPITDSLYCPELIPYEPFMVNGRPVSARISKFPEPLPVRTLPVDLSTSTWAVMSGVALRLSLTSSALPLFPLTV